MFPNPAAPQTDTNDEFVEIYNPNDEAVDLNGYTVQTGLTYAYSYHFTKTTSLAAHGFVVLTSGNTNLTLANNGGQARLLDPNGQPVSTTAAYGEAPEGQAWALINGQWQWTNTPTPQAGNVLTAPTSSNSSTTSSKTSAKKATTKTASAKKTTAKKFPTTKATKAQTLGAATDQSSNQDPAPTALHPGVLAGVGASAVLYVAYEYRGDVANRLYQLRRNLSARRTARAQS